MNQQTQTPSTETIPTPPPAKAAKSRSLSAGQAEVIAKLKGQFDVDEDQILFLNPDDPDEPWIPPGELTSIARQSGAFTNIAEGFDSYIDPLKQIVHSATVIDNAGKVFTRTGVATIGERAAGNDRGVDEHALAAARAIGSALRSAGFDPFRSGSIVSLKQVKRPTASEAEDRVNDLRAIHSIAREKGLITKTDEGATDDRAYRDWLYKHFRVMSAARLDEPTRKSLINKLKQEPDDEEMIA